MNIQALINKYKNKTNPKKGSLHDGGAIIGSEVDEDNFLYYVVKRGNNIALEKAADTNLASMEIILTSGTTSHSGKKV
jgi:hypothetical protein